MSIEVSSQKKAISNLDETIATLTATRDKLAAELNKVLPLRDQLIDGGNAIDKWIIHKEKNMYYQFGGFGIGRLRCSIVRHGVYVSLDTQELNKNYRLATPNEVKQHLEFLASKKPKVPFVQIKGETKMSQPKPHSTFDPTKCDFYMVTCRGIRGAKVRHATYEIAEAEAKKIAEKENHETWIVGVIASVKPVTKMVPQRTVEVSKR